MPPTAPSGGLEVALDTLMQGFVSARLSPEEYRARATDWTTIAASRPRTLLNGSAEVLFGTVHPYGYGGEGTVAITRDAAQVVHDRLVQPGQATLVVVGDVSPAAVDAAARSAFGRWKATVTGIPAIAAQAPEAHGPRLVVASHRTAQRQGSLVARGPARGSQDAVAFQVAAQMLGGGGSSRLYARLRALGHSFGVWSTVHLDRSATWMSVEASYAPNRAVEGMREVLASAQALRDGTFDDEDLDVARASLLADWRLAMSSPQGAMERYALDVTLGTNRVHDLPRLVARVTRADVVRVAKAYLRAEALHVVFVGDLPTAEVETLGLGPPTLLRTSP